MTFKRNNLSQDVIHALTLTLVLCLTLLSGCSDKEEILPPEPEEGTDIVSEYKAYVGHPFNASLGEQTNGYTIKNNDPEKLKTEYFGIEHFGVVCIFPLCEGESSIHVLDKNNKLVKIIKIQTTTWGTTTSYSYVPDTPTSTPTVVKLVVSEVKYKKFTAKINIQCDHLISNASISVGYDDSLVEFEKCETNDKAGGMAVDNAFAGKFVYNYVNADGTDFDGDYATLHFKVADEKLTSTVLYLTVNSLDDENLNAISNQVENGIVKYQDAADVKQDDSDYIEIDVDYSKYPIAPEDIGLTDVDSVTVANGEVLIFEDGKFQTLSTGETKIDIVYKDGSVGHFKIVIKEPEAVKLESSEAEATSKAASPVSEKKSGSSMGVIIGVVCVLCLALIAAEYLMIVKNKTVGDNKSANKDNDKDIHDTDESDDTNLSEPDEPDENEEQEETDNTDDDTDTEE